MGDLFEPFRADPRRAAILTDFDGTLAPIVADPAAARPLPGAVDVLHDLAGRYGLVGVVSGRPVSFLLEHAGPGLWLSGLYGLEGVADGERFEASVAAEWRAVVVGSVDRAIDRFGGLVEPKGLSMTIHFRTRPDLEDEVRAWAAEEAARSGLALRAAKASLELHPPVTADKGTVVEAAAADMASVCFLGDDVGDLPAFDGLDRLAATGVHTVRVAVSTPEAPAEVVARADVVVEGPEGALELLRTL